MFLDTILCGLCLDLLENINLYCMLLLDSCWIWHLSDLHVCEIMELDMFEHFDEKQIFKVPFSASNQSLDHLDGHLHQAHERRRELHEGPEHKTDDEFKGHLAAALTEVARTVWPCINAVLFHNAREEWRAETRQSWAGGIDWKFEGLLAPHPILITGQRRFPMWWHVWINNFPESSLISEILVRQSDMRL